MLLRLVLANVARELPLALASSAMPVTREAVTSIRSRSDTLDRKMAAVVISHHSMPRAPLILIDGGLNNVYNSFEQGEVVPPQPQESAEFL